MARSRELTGSLSNGRLVAGATMLCGLVLLAAVGAASRPLPSGSLRSITEPARLDYSRDPSVALRRLSPRFVEQSLGPTVADALGLGTELRSVTSPASAEVNPAAGLINRIVSPIYHCISGRQTEDPLSPPCVASFVGDNGGATYRGVTGDEIRVLVALGLSDSASLRRPSNGHFYDLRLQPSQDELVNMPWLARLRLLQSYFTDHYETYGRRVHLFAVAGLSGAPEVSRALARLAAITTHPFAVLMFAKFGGAGRPDFADELARRGIVSFNVSAGTLDDSLAAAHPGFVWGYQPGGETAAAIFGSYICHKVAHHPAVMSGNFGENGRARRLGLLRIADQPGFDGFIEKLQVVMKKCGAEVVDSEPYHEPNGCGTQVEDEAGGGTGTDDARAMAGFAAHHVTTVIWPACMGIKMARTAEAIGYTPEWVLWGAGSLDRNIFASINAWPGAVWDGHAVLVTPATFRGKISNRLCFRAMAATSPSVPADDISDDACDYYDGLRQFFTAIQAAGPVLNPTTLEGGMRALPAVASPNAETPACSYPVGNFTCVKDAEVEWWDSAGGGEPSPSFFGLRGGGCWRAMESGRRYPAGGWPAGNIGAQRRATDPCNLYGSHGAPST